MKKVYILLLAAVVSISTMSFRTSSNFENNLVAHKVNASVSNNVSAGTSNEIQGTTPLILVALAENSVAAVVVATAAAVALVENDNIIAKSPKDYQPIMQLIDLRKLDSRN